METPGPDENDSWLTHDLPHPLAWRYAHAGASGKRAGLRYPRTLAFAENITRFLALVNMAEEWHRRKGSPGAKPKDFDRPTFGTWQAKLRYETGSAGFLTRTESLKDEDGMARVEQMRLARNHFAHAGLGGGELTCKTWLEAAKVPMRGIQSALRGLTEYRLGWAKEEGGGWVWVESRGQVARRRSSIQRGSPPFKPGRVVLWGHGKALCLEPYFIVKDGHLLWLAAFDGREAKYTSAGPAGGGPVSEPIADRVKDCAGCRGSGQCQAIPAPDGAPTLAPPILPRDFEVLGCLAEGEGPRREGAVWEAWRDGQPRKRVTVRIVRGDTDRDRFKVLSSLEHSRMLSPIDVVDAEVDGQQMAAVVTPFEPGDTLARRLQDSGKLAPGEAMAHLTQVLDALDHAWRETGLTRGGLTHGGLTADDVLLTGEGVRLMNFGTAEWLGRPVTADLPAVSAILSDAIIDGAPPFFQQRLGSIGARVRHPVGDPRGYRTPHDLAQALQAAIALQSVPLEGALARDDKGRTDASESARVARSLLRHVEARWPQPIALAVQRVFLEQATGGEVATCSRACEAAEVAMIYALWRMVALDGRKPRLIRPGRAIELPRAKVKQLFGGDVALHLAELRAFQQDPVDSGEKPLVSLAVLLRALEWRVGSDLVLCGQPSAGFAPLIFALGTTTGSWPGDRIGAGKRGAWLHAGQTPTDLWPLVVLAPVEPDILLVRGVVGDTVRCWSSLEGRIVTRRDIKQAAAVCAVLGGAGSPLGGSPGHASPSRKRASA